jgi:hypothetical protein
MRYLTDGTHLYEFVSEFRVANYGLAKGTLDYTLVFDCKTEEFARLSRNEYAGLRLVEAAQGA